MIRLIYIVLLLALVGCEAGLVDMAEPSPNPDRPVDKPITPIKIDPEHRHITLAYFDQKSTVDYIGVVQGIPVCFDAKECATDTYALQNIHEHQVNFMENNKKQDGIAFIIIYFTGRKNLFLENLQ